MAQFEMALSGPFVISVAVGDQRGRASVQELEPGAVGAVWALRRKEPAAKSFEDPVVPRAALEGATELRGVVEAVVSPASREPARAAGSRVGRPEARRLSRSVELVESAAWV